METTNRQKHELLTPSIFKLVRFKAQKLIGHSGYTQADLDDIKQDLIQALLDRLPKYDSARSAFITFAGRVIDSTIGKLHRARRTKSRDFRCEAHSLNEEIETEDGVIERHETISQDDVDLQTGRDTRPADERVLIKIDVQTVLRELPPELRRIAEMLQMHAISEVVRELGIPRSTFCGKYLVPLRKAFREKCMEDYLR